MTKRLTIQQKREMFVEDADDAFITQDMDCDDLLGQVLST